MVDLNIKKILLVDPKGSQEYVPIGLLKIAKYCMLKGHKVQLVRCNKEGYPNVGHFNIAFVTSYFTWEWKYVWEAVKYAKQHADKVYLGGVYASLLPEHAEKSGAKVIKGILPEVENLRPAYELVPDCDYSIVHASRGCIRKCKFCAVPIIEGQLKEKPTIKHLVYPPHKRIIFFDNNILAIKNWEKIYLELLELNKQVDFNQGLDARIIAKKGEKLVKQLLRLRLYADKYTSIRMALDDIRYIDKAEKSAKLFIEHGLNGRRIMFYCLYNFEDDPEDFFERVKAILSWGCVAFPMRFQAIWMPYALRKNSYIGKNWTQKELRMVKEFIAKYGFGGALPPYLAEHFEKAKDFYEAFDTKHKRLEKVAKLSKFLV